MAILTVGAGQQYATLATAVAAAQDGDVVQVQAGTYTNDFATVTTKITIQGIGGMVNLVATVAPPNGRAILKTETDVTLDHIAISGAVAPNSNNGAGILHVGGNLSVNASYFHNNQDGVLIGPDVSPIGAVLFLNSEFAFNGITNGQTHNLYVTTGTSLVVKDSYFHDVTLGHEIKSGADVNVIENNVIADGPSSTASYSIDLFNGGTDTVTGNVIEKGQHAVNGSFIHLGGGASTSLLVSNNTVIDDANSVLPYLVLNQAASGVVPTISNNSVYSPVSFTYASGAANVVNNTSLSTEPSYSTASPYLSAAELDFVATPTHAVTTNPGGSVSLFSGFTFTAPYDGQVTVTLSGWNTALGGVSFTGGDAAISVQASGSTTLTVQGLASSIAADFNGGLFQYAMSAQQGTDTVQVTINDPAVILDLGTGGAAALETSFAVSLAAPAPQAVISALYLAILGRPADSGGLAGWVAAVNQGTTYAQVRSALANSAEAQSDIGALYQAVLGRAADSAGLASFVQSLAGSGSLATVRAALANSGEAQSDIGALYQAVLGRAADRAGLANFVQSLAGSGSLATVRAALANSGEAQSDIGALYQAVLGRAADSAGLANFVQSLAGSGSLATVRATLANSAEAQSAIGALYQAVLGRAADSAGLASFVQSLAGSGSLATVRATLANSTEAQSDIGALYQAVLGRAADSAGLASFVQSLVGSGSLATVRATLANSTEAQSDIGALYQAVLGRAADSAGLASFVQSLAGSGSLATVRAALANSGEAQSDIGALYQAVLGRAADSAGLANFVQSLAGGGSLATVRAALANSGEAQSDIGALYQAILGRAVDSSGLANAIQGLATNGSLSALRSGIANSAESQGKVTAVLQVDFGRAPTGSEIAAGQVQLASGLSLTDLNTQTLRLASNPTFVTGTGGTFQATAGVDVFAFGPGSFGVNIIAGFDINSDILVFDRTQFANLNVVQAHETTTSSGTLISLDASNTILLQGVSVASLIPADMRFA